MGVPFCPECSKAHGAPTRNKAHVPSVHCRRPPPLPDEHGLKKICSCRITPCDLHCEAPAQISNVTLILTLIITLTLTLTLKGLTITLTLALTLTLNRTLTFTLTLIHSFEPQQVRPDKYVTRRVIGLHGSYWLVCKKYKCEACKGAGRQWSFNMWDTKVLALLHPSIADSLGVMFTWKLAVTQELVDYIEDHAVCKVSFEAMATHLKSNHHRSFTRAHLAYVSAVDYYNIAIKRSANANRQLLEPEEWGAFRDPNGWGGHVPGAAYLVAIFLAKADQSEPFLKRSLQMVDAEVIAGDASLKVPKFIRISGGARCKKFLYTLMNGHGEIAGLWFVDQDSRECLLPKFQATNDRFVAQGLPCPRYAWGDNCCGKDRAMFEDAWPSLKAPHEAKEVLDRIKENQQGKLPKATFNRLKCDTNYKQIRTRADANEFALGVLMNCEQYFIGLDAEWTWGTTGSRVDVLTMCVEKFGQGGTPRVVLFRLNEICHEDRALPSELLRLLQSNDKRFVGVNIQGDLTRLGRHHNCDLGTAVRNLPPRNIVDAGHLAHELDPVTYPRRQVGMHELTAKFLVLDVEKGDATPRMSQWDASDLTPAQLQYAALDAAISLALHKAMWELVLKKRRRTARDFVPGDTVKLFVTGHTAIAARGVVTQQPAIEGLTNVVWVHPTDVVAPSAFLPNTTLTLEDALNQSPTQRVPWHIGLVGFDDEHAAGPPLPSDVAAEVPPEDAAMEETPSVADEHWEKAFWDAGCNHPRQRVMIDMLHIMKRLGDTFPTGHTLRERFMSRLRDVFFAINDDDIIRLMKDLIDSGWSEDAVHDKYASNYRYFVRKVRRRVPKPQDLLAAFNELVTIFTPTQEKPHIGFCPHLKVFLLAKQSTQDQIVSMRRHIANGCCTDPEDFEMYNNVGTTTKPKYYCSRGTSALEGFHAHLRRFFVGHSTSPRLAHALIMLFVFRWNLRHRLAHRGGVDFGHPDVALLHRLHKMMVKVGEAIAKPSAGATTLITTLALALSPPHPRP